MTNRKKLIEVALPLDEINAASFKEKKNPFLKGHPRNVHQYWSRKPLAACRAVLFASLVDDPSNDLPEDEAQVERERLFNVIRELVKWENSSDEAVLRKAHKEILRSTGGEPPAVLDPFCGGGSIPLEAQRLGLEAHGSDLNPVAVMITKALIELPPKFACQPPVNPESRKTADLSSWRGAQGLAEDVRFYGAWMREKAKERIGHLYPTGPNGETIIAWLWARTVRCPNPACGATMPLVSSFWLSKKPNRKAWVEPVVVGGTETPDGKTGVRFVVKDNQKSGAPPNPPKLGRGAKFRYLVCDQISDDAHIKAEGKAGRMGQQLMAVVAEGYRGRRYLPAAKELVPQLSAEESSFVETARQGFLSGSTPEKLTGGTCYGYGLTTWGDLFTPRQLIALGTFADLVGKARDLTRKDAFASGLSDQRAAVYADAVATYLSLSLDKLADYGNSLCSWNSENENISHLFTKQAIPMMWSFAEASTLYGGVTITNLAEGIVTALPSIDVSNNAEVRKANATEHLNLVNKPVISSDPPYYDNIGYSDVSDFFYVWLRRTLGDHHPDVFGTMLTPKEGELVASSHRFGGDKHKARQFFEEGIGKAFIRMRERANPDYPVTIYYAFKQAESEKPSANGGGDGNDHGVLAVASTGWETMLNGLIEAGFQITGTWPVRTERSARSVAIGTNALASSVVMVCRSRPENAPVASRRDFQNALRRELPGALEVMMRENIAPVDLAQVTIGPGMAIYSRYSAVLENDGTPLGVRTALQLINQQLDAVLAEQDGDLDGESRFCVAWYEQFGTGEGDYGLAETLSKAKNTSLRGLAESGVLAQRAGEVRLLKREEMPETWDPAKDDRTNAWETAQHLVKAVLKGEKTAATIVRKLGPDRAEQARQLAYRLYQICDRKKRPEEAFAYNALSQSWERVVELSRQEEEGVLF